MHPTRKVDQPHLVVSISGWPGKCFLSRRAYLDTHTRAHLCTVYVCMCVCAHLCLSGCQVRAGTRGRGGQQGEVAEEKKKRGASVKKMINWATFGWVPSIPGVSAKFLRGVFCNFCCTPDGGMLHILYAQFPSSEAWCVQGRI